MKIVKIAYLSAIILGVIAFSLSGCDKGSESSGSPMYVIATDYVVADGYTDVADKLQEMIDENPRRTIFFPDGTYILSHPLVTPADPKKAVHLELANFATLKAKRNGWDGSGAIIRLGGKDPSRDIMTNGSNYGVEGGIIDGDDIADGISIESGRETRVSGVSIKHTRVGIHIQHGSNSGSSDSDIRDVNIVGNSSAESIGVLIEGYDNTLTNMRIYGCNTGVLCKTGGNSLKNIHPLYKMDDQYESGRAFVFEGGNNWLDYCYSDQYAKGFVLSDGVDVNLINCFVYWYSGSVPFQTAIESKGKFDALVFGLHLGFSESCKEVSLLKGAKGGKGCIKDVYMADRQLSSDDVSSQFLK